MIPEEHLSLIQSQAAVTTLDEHIYLLAPTNKTPLMFVNGAEGVLVLAGRLIPQDGAALFAPILEFVETHLSSEVAIRAYFRIEYTNSSSLEFIANLLKKLDERFLKGQELTINWFYEEDDDEMLDHGTYYETYTHCPFELIEIEEGEEEKLDKSIRELV